MVCLLSVADLVSVRISDTIECRAKITLLSDGPTCRVRRHSTCCTPVLNTALKTTKYCARWSWAMACGLKKRPCTSRIDKAQVVQNERMRAPETSSTFIPAHKCSGLLMMLLANHGGKRVHDGFNGNNVVQQAL